MWTVAELPAGIRRALSGVHRSDVDRGRPPFPTYSTSRQAAEEPEGGWPGVSVLIPAYNEEAVIATSVAAAHRL